MTLNDQRMIAEIAFTKGNNTYCVDQIQQAFSHLPLNIWRFYSVEGSRLTDVTSICDFDTFDLETLALYLLHHFHVNDRIASGNTTNGALKKIYIGPIAPQSFLVDEDTSSNEQIHESEGEDIVSDQDMSNTRQSVSRNPETSPSVSCNLAQRSSGTKSHVSYLRSNDPIPEGWKSELHEIIQSSLNDFFEEWGTSKSNTIQRQKRPAPNTVETPKPRQHSTATATLTSSSPKRRPTTPMVSQSNDDL
jgi:hypothetical protein